MTVFQRVCESVDDESPLLWLIDVHTVQFHSKSDVKGLHGPFQSPILKSVMMPSGFIHIQAVT